MHSIAFVRAYRFSTFNDCYEAFDFLFRQWKHKNITIEFVANEKSRKTFDNFWKAVIRTISSQAINKRANRFSFTEYNIFIKRDMWCLVHFGTKKKEAARNYLSTYK